MPRTPRIYTVQGITANLKTHADHYGVNYPLAHARMFKHQWTVEQALGLAPRPPPKPRGRTGTVRGFHCTALGEDGPRLASAKDNFMRAALRLISGEEFLRLEGVPMNGHPLRVLGDE